MGTKPSLGERGGWQPREIPAKKQPILSSITEWMCSTTPGLASLPHTCKAQLALRGSTDKPCMEVPEASGSLDSLIAVMPRWLPGYHLHQCLHQDVSGHPVVSTPWAPEGPRCGQGGMSPAPSQWLPGPRGRNYFCPVGLEYRSDVALHGPPESSRQELGLCLMSTLPSFHGGWGAGDHSQYGSHLLIMKEGEPVTQHSGSAQQERWKRKVPRNWPFLSKTTFPPPYTYTPFPSFPLASKSSTKKRHLS